MKRPSAACPWPPRASPVHELLEEELVLQERRLVLRPRVRRNERGGLDEPPTVLQGGDARLVRGFVAVAGRRAGGARAVVAGPSDDRGVEGGGVQVQDE